MVTNSMAFGTTISMSSFLMKPRARRRVLGGPTKAVESGEPSLRLNPLVHRAFANLKPLFKPLALFGNIGCQLGRESPNYFAAPWLGHVGKVVVSNSIRAAARTSRSAKFIGFGFPTPAAFCSRRSMASLRGPNSFRNLAVSSLLIRSLRCVSQTAAQDSPSLRQARHPL